MPPLDTYIIAAKTVTLAFGGLVTLFAYRAYRRTRSPALRALAVGLGLVAAGALVAGAADQLLGVDLVVGVAVQSTFTAAGFAVLAYSLYAGEADRASGPADGRPEPASRRGD